VGSKPRCWSNSYQVLECVIINLSTAVFLPFDWFNNSKHAKYFMFNVVEFTITCLKQSPIHISCGCFIQVEKGLERTTCPPHYLTTTHAAICVHQEVGLRRMGHPRGEYKLRCLCKHLSVIYF